MKFIFGLQINIKVFYKLTWSFWVCETRHAQSTQNKFVYLFNISRKAWCMKSIFCLQVNTKVFYKIMVSLWMCVSRHTQSTLNKNFTISLQYVKENVKDDVDFLSASKCERFLWSDTIICVWPGMPKLPKITSLLFLCNILRKNWLIKLIFCMQIRIKACYKLMV